jgi:formylglycine-generating enzyme required for sulfatase activity
VASDLPAGGDRAQRTPALPVQGKTGPYELKVSQPEGERREADTQPSSRRGWSKAVWLPLALLLASGAIAVLFFVRESGRDRQGSDVAENGADEEQIAAEMNALPAEFTNDIGMKLVRIPPGKFTMGSPLEEQGHKHNEKQHDVEITRPFWMGAYEVTQKQFRELMGYNPSYFGVNTRPKKNVRFAYQFEPGGGIDRVPKGDDTEEYPVENVVWGEGVGFCDRLTARDRSKPAGWQYRLPTEAEWEYACREGSPTYSVFHFGNSLSSRDANFNAGLPYDKAAPSASLERTCKVGSYQKNGFGLYDMHGNVCEWCLDRFAIEYYRVSPMKDPMGPVTGEGLGRVMRGGSWQSPGERCRSANRFSGQTAARRNNVGFRVALVPPKK